MKNKKVLIIVAAVLVVAVVLGIVLLGGSKEYKLGMGAVAGSHNASQTNLTIATVVTDKDGKIVSCRIDVAQNKYSVKEVKNDEGEVTGYAVNFSVLDSKRELKEDYKMKPASPISKEWYEQAEAFESWVVGKTGAEVAELLKKDNLVQSGTHWVTTDEVLKAGCTIDVQDFRDAVVKACNDEQGVTFTADKEFTLGLAVNSADNSENKSSAKALDKYTINLNVEFAASVVIDGKVVATVNDAYQPTVVVDGKDEDNKLIVKSANVGKVDGQGKDLGFMTKRELKEYYGMKAAKIDKGGSEGSEEWYVQSATYSQYVIGKTASEIAGLTLNDELMNAGCTIYIGGINAVVAESVTNAR